MKKKSLSESRKLKNQIQKIEREISQIEKNIEDLQLLLNTEEVMNDYKKYNQISDDIELTSSHLEELLEQWESLQDE